MAETKRAKPSLDEVGYVNGDGTDWQHWDQNEKVPELQWPQAINVYSRMMKEDGRVASVIQAIGLPIRRTAWRIDPNGASPEVTAFVAQNLGLPIKASEAAGSMPRTRGRFSWAKHLQAALLMLPYGHSYFEQVYRVDDQDRTWLHKLAPRPQKSISKITVALDGGLESITQNPPAGPLTVASMLPDGFVIPVSRLVAYTRDAEPGDWLGSSLLRPAYKHWILKDELMRIQAAAARRNGMGIPVGTAAAEDDQEEVDQMQQIASNLRGGMASGVGLAKGQALALLGVQGNLPDMQQAIEYHDKQIALAGLAHFLNLDRGGSYSLASVLNDTFVQSVQTFAESIAETANAHIVEDLVDINFGEEEPAPRIVFDEIGSRQDATAAALSMLVQAGLLEPDDVLKITVRQSLGLPSKNAEPEQPAPAPEEGVTE
ncbi:phage portal protein family protein [Rhodococcoides corynebacterioides]|uniref:phage portal protein family protein n=1 Tax=Rhodococcoides corynebacterioides TaxID=53972 RepID=UPI003F82201F